MKSLKYIALFALFLPASVGAVTTTLMLGTDTLSSSRTVINNNFINLNNGKVELGGDIGGTTTTPRLSIASQAAGAMLYFNGSLWRVILPGSSTQSLTVSATGTPNWTTLPSNTITINGQASSTFQFNASGTGLSVVSSSPNVLLYTLNHNLFLQSSNNLSDLVSTSTARSNLGYSAGNKVSISSTGTIGVTTSSISQWANDSGFLTAAITKLADLTDSIINLLGTGGITVSTSSGSISLGWNNSPGYTSSTGANPSASIGLAATNGSASTFLRSDGAPALSQSITPTWTGIHLFRATTTHEANLVLSSSTCSGGQVLSTNASGTVVCVTDQTGGGGGNFA